MSDVFDRAPKVELHLHLEGAIPLPTLWELVDGYGDSGVQTFDALASRFQYRDFPHFIETWWWMTGFLRTSADFSRAARAVASTLAEQNIIYAEASISPSDFARHGLSVGEVATAVRSGIDQVSGVVVGMIVDLVRDTGPETCMNTLEQVIDIADETGVVGITIGGSEHDFPPQLFRDVYRKADSAGLGLTAHAGEAAGSESVWAALRDLGVSRIGHGIRSLEDPELVDYLVQHQIPLEVCPTSNIRTGVVESWDRHPVFDLIERGVRVTINSDDPLFFDCSLAGDLRKVSEYIDFDVERHTHYAIEASWMGEAHKALRHGAVADWWDSYRRR